MTFSDAISAAQTGMTLAEFQNSYRVINNKGDTLFNAGDNAANAPLWVELFSAAEVTRRPLFIKLNKVVENVAIAGNSLLIGSGAAGAEVEVLRIPRDSFINAITGTISGAPIPISQVASGVRIAAMSELSDGDGAADAALLQIVGAILFG